eukprot:CAMPEP_0201949134 /NCGR_PEP_ID=MMETSP0903-20130614/55819_1 /ASSEMBLY_ACC=CAM_ASM_000552 /TAXON_ID=420261 /ORGANISM="Thalassiosira antarctica, Strain CCMP982" /LENGTH=66 /DNA_ID=CAMNT_0048492333 /DNA_START=548 /DNA_END=750 /DNA_ORIENTATION=+
MTPIATDASPSIAVEWFDLGIVPQFEGIMYIMVGMPIPGAMGIMLGYAADDTLPVAAVLQCPLSSV